MITYCIVFHAQGAGLEPATYGFGDHRSTRLCASCRFRYQPSPLARRSSNLISKSGTTLPIIGQLFITSPTAISLSPIQPISWFHNILFDYQLLTLCGRQICRYHSKVKPLDVGFVSGPLYLVGCTPSEMGGYFHNVLRYRIWLKLLDIPNIY